MESDVNDPDVTADDILSHFGVLGMRWGVRNKVKGPSREDVRWARKAGSAKTFSKVYKEMADGLNSTDLPRINSDPRFVNLTRDSPPSLHREYHEEVVHAATNQLNDSLARNVGISPSGKFIVVADYSGDGGYPKLVIVPSNTQIDHEDVSVDPDPVELDVVWSEDGHILKINIPVEEMNPQEAIDLAMDSFEDDPDGATQILIHYGVLGMKWGIRRDLDRLSDDDLKKTIERMRLEKQYKEIANPRAGRAFIAKHGDKVLGSVLSAATAFFVKDYLNKKYGPKT